MAFQVEISLHIHHTEPIGKISGTLIDLAERMQCYRHYIRHKTAKKPYIRIRNHVILTLFFPEKESKIIYFLIQLKKFCSSLLFIIPPRNFNHYLLLVQM